MKCSRVLSMLFAWAILFDFSSSLAVTSTTRSLPSALPQRAPKTRRPLGFSSASVSRRIISVEASMASTEGEEEEDTEASILAGIRREALTRNYNVGFALYLVVALLLLAMPDRTYTVKLASKLGGAAGYGLASGVSYILAGATSHDRLASDTYKRLNVGLLLFSWIGMIAVPAEAGFHPKFIPSMLLIWIMAGAKIFGTQLAYKGWKRGVEGGSEAVVAPRQMLLELWNGTLSTLAGLVKTTRKGRAYRNYVLLVIIGGISAIKQGLFNMGYQASLFSVSLQWSAFSRLFLVASMIFSLKDAAERDRLSGTTFIQMNFMLGLWALAVGIGQGTSQFGFSTGPALMLCFCVPFFTEGIKYQRRKLQKEAVDK